MFSFAIAKYLSLVWKLQSSESKRALWRIGLFATLVSFLEMSVAGLVSLLGTALTAPQRVLSLAPVTKALSGLPVVVDQLQQPAVLLAAIMAFVVLGVCLKNILSCTLTYKQNYFGYKIAMEFGERLLKSFMRKPYTWHMRQNAGELAAVMQFRPYVGSFLSNMLTLCSQGLIGLCLFAGGLFFAPFATLSVLGITGITAGGIYIFAKKRLQRHNDAIAKVAITSNKDILAALHGIREVKIYGREKAVERNIVAQYQSIISDTAYSAVYPLLPSWVLESIGFCMLSVTLWGMVWAGLPLAQITGTLTLLAAMAWRLLPCMNKTVAAIVSMQGTLPYLDRFFRAMEENSEKLDDAQASASQPVSFTKAIALHGVSFRYQGMEKDALHDFSMHIPKGGSVGIVGTSGAGKSTLIGIVTGLLQPSSGEMSVDGARVAGGGQITRLRIGYVPQSFYMLDASLAQNVAFSAFGEPVDEEKVLAACKLAALDFWEQLPQGIHTELGEHGVRISGGQAQRVAIARALYAEPELLVFDEATSALDGATEAAILKTIEGLHSHMTIVMIAHRLSTVAHCDTIYWMDGGAVVRFGPPDQVLPAYEAAQENRQQME